MPPESGTRGGLSAAEKRSARFKKAQAALTPEQLAEQDRQNRTVSMKPVVSTTAYELKMARRWFAEFMKDIYPWVDVDASYFTPGASAPDMVILKEYGRYLVRSRVGRINDKLSVNTVQHYMAMIISIIQRICQHPAWIISPMRAQIRDFVRGDLVAQEGVRTTMHTKAVAHSEDVTFILSMLYSPHYLNTFSNMRTVLNLTLYILLMIDLCGRGADIARHPLRPEHMCLRWEDVSFYSFQHEDEASFDIRAQITVRWSKGQTLDESAYRVIPIPALLPTSMALQDTLRMLLTVALMDGVFSDGVQTWEHLFSLRLPADVAKTGRRIAMKADMLKVPVLRRMDNHRVMNIPVYTSTMQDQIRRLGLFCGFEHRLVAYCFRRGVAYILAHDTTQENRKFLMGHKTDSKVFSSYQSRISTIDFAALFRHIDERPVNAQAGISLNRSTAPPLTVSKAGEQAIIEDEEVQAAFREMETVRTAIKAKHPSLAAAARTSDPLWNEFKQLLQTHKSAVKSAAKRILHQEYKQHFEQLSVKLPTSLQQAQRLSDDSSLDNVQSNRDRDDSPLFVAEDEIFDATDPFAPEDTVDQALDLIDPRLRGDSEDHMPIEEEEFFNEMLGKEDTPDPSPTDTVQSPTTTASAADTGGDTPDMALHGRPNNVRSTLKNRVLSKKGCSAYNDMLADLESKETEADISECMISWYKVCHPIDYFPLGEEPVPGTFDCHFCGEDLSQYHHAYEHTYACAKEAATARAQALLDSLCPLDQPCQYQVCGNKANFGRFVACNQTFKTAAERGEHMRSHIRTMSKKDTNGNKVPTCFFGDCASNPERGRLNRNGPDFAGELERLAHVWSEHHVTSLKTPGVAYCEYCSTWLLEPHEWTTHATNHLDDARSIIIELGYCGIRAGRDVFPRLCPFCFHQEALPTYKRIATYGREGHLVHLAAHIQSANETLQRCPCYPSMCTMSAEIDAVQLRDHLNVVHDCNLPARHSGSRKALSDTSNIKATSRKIAKVARAG